MSIRDNDSIEDTISDREMDLLEKYLENPAYWAAFCDWIYGKEQDNVRERLFEHFLNSGSPEYQKFLDWAREQVVSDIADRGNPDE